MVRWRVCLHSRWNCTCVYLQANQEPVFRSTYLFFVSGSAAESRCAVTLLKSSELWDQSGLRNPNTTHRAFKARRPHVAIHWCAGCCVASSVWFRRAAPLLKLLATKIENLQSFYVSPEMSEVTAGLWSNLPCKTAVWLREIWIIKGGRRDGCRCEHSRGSRVRKLKTWDWVMRNGWGRFRGEDELLFCAAGGSCSQRRFEAVFEKERKMRLALQVWKIPGEVSWKTADIACMALTVYVTLRSLHSCFLHFCECIFFLETPSRHWCKYEGSSTFLFT